MSRYTNKEIYRSRHGKIFGVCQGVANYFGISAFWIRIIFVTLFIFSGFFPFGFLYIAAAIIMKKEPRLYRYDSESEFEYNENQDWFSFREKLYAVKNKFDNLNQRVNRMEDIVTDRENDWERRFADNA